MRATHKKWLAAVAAVLVLLAVVLGVVAGLLNLPVKEHAIERTAPISV